LEFADGVSAVKKRTIQTQSFREKEEQRERFNTKAQGKPDRATQKLNAKARSSEAKKQEKIQHKGTREKQETIQLSTLQR
jgi:hypothetical protein